MGNPLAAMGKVLVTIRDAAFPLYEESGQYSIAALQRFYYERARETAERFDKRNGSDYYCRQLAEALA